MESQVLNISYKILDKSQTRSISHFYKSLLRRFRDFIKTHFETTYVKRSTSQHWDDETLFRKVGNYMRDKIGIPDNLITHEDVYKMICLTKPARGRKLGFLEYQNETQFLFKIFDENTVKLREIFFADSLIQHLWKKFFIFFSPEIVTDYIRFVRTANTDGDFHADKLLHDLTLFQSKHGIKLLPKDPL